MKKWLLTLLLLSTPALADGLCGQAPHDRDFWMDVRSGALPEGKTPDALSPLLVSCLSSPDPVLRDRLGYEILTLWLRSGALSDQAVQDLTPSLLAGLQAGLGETGTDTVFGRTFSALILSEVMRRDAQSRVLSDGAFQQVVQGISQYLKGEKDLRARTDQQGWMHGVAHAADVLWRIAENPRTTTADLDTLLAALQEKIAPEQPTFYAHNEPERMARVIATLLSQGNYPVEKLQVWLEDLVLGVNWRGSFDSDLGMARLHNTKLFFRAFYFQILYPPVGEGASKLDSTVRRALNTLNLF